MRLHDKVTLITGGGSGIGEAICRLFAREGATVVAVDRYLARAEQTIEQLSAEGSRGIALQADVARRSEVELMAQHALERLGRVDVLVNNAAIAEGDDILTIDEETWDLNLRVVLKSVYLCSRALLPDMLARRQGAIVNIASVNGLMGIGEEAYSAAKAGVINLTKNLAVRYGPRGVRANVICPGTIQTPIWQNRVDQDPTVFERLAQWYPLGRVGQPDDVAQAALFLASDEAAWITGAALNVDGGLMAGSYRMSRDLSGDGE
jgi:NAD(P)-dependent dehydrogenase (short-subunit alcohol dehydrogenase family)